MKNIVVIGGARGVGKGTIVSAILKRYPDKFGKIVTFTTREPREGEVDGDAYFFTDKNDFETRIASGDIFERTEYNNQYYGMSKTVINKIVDNGKIAIVDIDFVGLLALREIFAGQVVGIYVTATLERIKRHLEKYPIELQKQRLADYENSHKTMEYYDHVVVNDGADGTVNEAVEKVLKILG